MANLIFNLRSFLPALAFACLPGMAFALHGNLAGTQRDAWIDGRVEALVSAGWVRKPGKPTADLTNLEVAQLTKEAVEYRMAQVDLPPDLGAPPPLLPDPILLPGSPAPSAGASFQELVAEFREELSMMEVDLAKLEERLEKARKRSNKFGKLQEEYLKRTGTAVAGYSRAYFDQYRGFGPDRVYGPMDFHGILYADVHLKSVPVPFVLFDAKVRVTRTIGMYYADPITPNFALRWISLSNKNEVADLTAGDFYRSYTKLTLWNNEIPVYHFVEPSSYKRLRKNAEEIVYMDHGPDWHLRGFEAASDKTLEKGAFLNAIHLQAMVGDLRSAAAYSFGKQYAGAQTAFDFLEDLLEVKAAGLVLWDDISTSDAPTVPGLPSTYPRQYNVGSLSAKVDAPIAEGISAGGAFEYGVSLYQDNVKGPDKGLFQDWAMSIDGHLDVLGVKVGAKFLDNGPYFYSPGAQTNRYAAATGSFGYLTTNLLRDNQLIGYLNNYVFQTVNLPAFAPYDRMLENILPYGDASPNRRGLILGLSGGIGKEGWIQPKGSYVLQMQEIQPNYVLTGPGVSTVLPVDSQDPTAVARVFGGWEAALVLDFAKGLEGLPANLSLAGDYKHQTSDTGFAGSEPFTVDTFVVTADAGPFPTLPLLEGVVLTAAYAQSQSKGDEFFLTGSGSPPTLAQYHSLLDSDSLGAYGSGLTAPQPMSITRTSLAIGFKVPLSRNFELRGDWFINKYTWAEMPAFDRREQIWVMGYELTF